MEHTLSASTGMPRRDYEMIFCAKTQTGQDAIAQMAGMKPTTEFGETFQYSNHLVAAGGFAAANVYANEGSLIEKYCKAMKDLVFDPLHMNHTFVCPAGQPASSMASAHAIDLDKNVVTIPQTIKDFVYPVAPSGCVLLL